MTERRIDISSADGVRFVAHSPDGRRIESDCGASQTTTLAASELLLASLGSCIAASLTPLLQRHGADPGALRISVYAAALPGPIDVSITLPPDAEYLQTRCLRASRNCPVLRSLAVPVELSWRTE